MEKNVIAIDLGGTKILTALMNSNDNIIDQIKIPTDISKGAKNIVKSIAESVNEILTQTNSTQESIRAICLGVPGTVDPNKGTIGSAPNLGIKNYNIKNAMQKHFDIPVLIENDVNLAAIGIKKYEFADKVNNMLVVFVGTGIGGGLIFNGKLYRGSSFYAGEIGHIKVSAKGCLSPEKTKLTFEGVASRTAVVAGIEKDIRKKKKSSLKKYVKDDKKIKSSAISDALKDKDKVTMKHVNRASEIIGTVLGSLTTLLNLDTIVLGGGLLESSHNYMMPRIRKAFRESVLPEPGKFAKIVLTKLGDDAALYGGVPLAEEFLP